MPIEDCSIKIFKTFPEFSGNLSAVEGERDIPFEIRRVFYLYGLPAGAIRARHAHKKLHQVIIAVSGRFDVHLDDGHTNKTFPLSKPSEGLYVPPMIWGELRSFSNQSVCLVLASDFYDEEDYYRRYEDFLSA